MNCVTNLSVPRKVKKTKRFLCLSILLATSSVIHAETADELYTLGYKEYAANNYIGAIKFLSAYKYHPDSKKTDPEKLKDVEKVLQYSEKQLTKCNGKSYEHADGGAGASFGGKARLQRKE